MRKVVHIGCDIFPPGPPNTPQAPGLEVHPAAWFPGVTSYESMVSPTGLAWMCSTAALAPPGLIPRAFGGDPQNRKETQGQYPTATTTTHTAGSGSARIRTRGASTC